MSRYPNNHPDFDEVFEALIKKNGADPMEWSDEDLTKLYRAISAIREISEDNES